MYKLPLIILLMLSLVCCCNSYDKRLTLAESLMDTHPDSALALLNGITDTQNLSLANRAYFALEYTRACDKLGMLPQSDSLINVAVDYYDHHGSDQERTLAYFYQGRVYSERKSHKSAITAFLESLHTLKPTQNRLACCIYQNLGHHYYYTNYFRESLNMYWLAIKEAKDDSLLIGNIYGLMAKTYDLAGKNDSVLYYTRKAIDLNRMLGDSGSIALRYIDLAQIYMDKALYQQAFDCVTKSICYDSALSSNDLYAYTKALLFDKLKQTDSAASYYKIAASSSNIYRRYGSFNYLYQIYKQAGEAALSNYYADSCLIYSDSISTLQNQNGVAELILQYKRDLKEQQIASAQKQNILYVVIILVLLGLIFVSLILRNRQMRIAYQRKLTEVKLQYINQMAQTDDASLNSEIREESLRDVMRRKQLQLACGQFANTRYGKRLVTMKSENGKFQQTLSHEERESLKEKICYIFSDCILELKSANPSINNEDIIYCMLSAMKYSNSVIAECVNVSNSTLRSRKSRLKAKLSPEIFDIYF